MLYNYNEILKIYKDDYSIKRAIQNKEIFKIGRGLYSNEPNVHYLKIISKKYLYAVISGHSAYYYHNLTDVIPRKIIVCTDRHSTRINNSSIKQIHMKDELYNLGKTQIEYDGIVINIYDKERLLIDLARNKNKMGYDLYKEIISNYRKISDTLNIKKIEEYISYFANGDKLFEIIQNEVF